VRFYFSAALAIHDHLRLNPTREAGGLLLGDAERGEVIWACPVENAAEDQRSEFRIEAEAMARVLAGKHDHELLGTFHSHPGGPAVMSRADAAVAENTGLMLIVATYQHGWEWALFDPVAGGRVEPVLCWPGVCST
jgi:proteasome lid subunit RPN8/RPN11